MEAGEVVRRDPGRELNHGDIRWTQIRRDQLLFSFFVSFEYFVVNKKGREENHETHEIHEKKTRLRTPSFCLLICVNLCDLWAQTIRGVELRSRRDKEKYGMTQPLIPYPLSLLLLRDLRVSVVKRY
jgi:hypothetical protein